MLLELESIRTKPDQPRERCQSGGTQLTAVSESTWVVR